VTPLSLGVKHLVEWQIIARNTQFQLKNLRCSQQQLIIKQMLKFIYRVKELVAGNKSLGNFRLDGIQMRRWLQIEVTFDIDVDGTISKSSRKETGVEQSVTIQGASFKRKS
jgi:molecular chaperone DnaK (HSP70)